MRPNDILALLVVWGLPFIAAYHFNSIHPLLGWIGSTIVSYWIVTYEAEDSSDL